MRKIGIFLLLIVYIFPSNIFAAEIKISAIFPQPEEVSEEFITLKNTDCEAKNLDNYFIETGGVKKKIYQLSGTLPGSGEQKIFR